MPNPSSRAPVVTAVLAFLSLTLLAAPTASADQSVTVPVVRLEGRGHGHGVGMSQWGAFTMARDGASASDIIATFYPGTDLSHLGGEVVVSIDRRDHVRIQLPAGGEIRSARSGQQHAGFPVSVPPGGVVDIVREPGGFRVSGGAVVPLESAGRTRYSAPSQECFLILCSPEEPPSSTQPPSSTTTTTTAPGAADDTDGDRPPPPTEPAPPAPPAATASDPVAPTAVWAVPAGGSTVRSVDRDRAYRGLFEVTGAPGAVRVRNHVDVEDYLKGMAEVPGNWPAAAVQAQAIAARTYALRAMRTAGELCDTESCQVYAGTGHESAGQTAAVDATRNVVVTHADGLASTFYSASGGGFSANVAEGFGTPSDVPYLQARPYRTVHPDEWTVDIALADVARRLDYPGSIEAVRIEEVGPSGRPLRMTLDGDAGPVGVDPQDFRRRLGLRSTLFSVSTTATEAAPPPPPATVDPGVVGAAADTEAPYAPVRRPVRADRGDELALVTTTDDPAMPLGAAALAFVLLVGTWSALTVRSMASPPLQRATMSGWLNRFRSHRAASSGVG